jgi:FAD/FMN-containing dehydrogenase
MSDLAETLAEICALAGDHAPYETDWTGRTTGRALAVALPSTTEQVSAVLRACADAGAA